MFTPIPLLLLPASSLLIHPGPRFLTLIMRTQKWKCQRKTRKMGTRTKAVRGRKREEGGEKKAKEERGGKKDS